MADETAKRTRKTTEAKTTAKKTTAKKTTSPARKAPARKAAATPRSRRASRRTITHDQIAARAYQLHLEGHGDAFANWLRAEAELATA